MYIFIFKSEGMKTKKKPLKWRRIKNDRAGADNSNRMAREVHLFVLVLGATPGGARGLLLTQGSVPVDFENL